MSLYCTACRTLAEDGSAVCAACGNGFTSQLACANCHRPVARGTAFCVVCARAASPSLEVAPPPDLDRDRMFIMRRPSPALGNHGSSPQRPPPGGLAHLPPLPGISLEQAYVHDSYQAGEFGAIAEVQMNGRDADIMTKMNQTVVLLHALAQEMNNFQALSDNTRRVIKGCRNLATMLQEEVETRVGKAGR